MKSRDHALKSLQKSYRREAMTNDRAMNEEDAAKLKSMVSGPLEDIINGNSHRSDLY